jgi:hypothetical protein
MSATGHAGREPLRVAPMGFRFASAGMVGLKRMDGFRCTFMRLPSRRRRNMSARRWIASSREQSLSHLKPSQLVSARNSPLRDILHDGFVRSPHRHDPRAFSRFSPC